MMELEFEDFPLHQFFSMEYLNRRPLMYKLAKKLNTWFDYDFRLQDGMYCTVPSCADHAWCWQSIVSEVDVPLQKMSLKDYRRQFGKTRKTKK